MNKFLSLVVFNLLSIPQFSLAESTDLEQFYSSLNQPIVFLAEEVHHNPEVNRVVQKIILEAADFNGGFDCVFFEHNSGMQAGFDQFFDRIGSYQATIIKRHADLKAMNPGKLHPNSTAFNSEHERFFQILLSKKIRPLVFDFDFYSENGQRMLHLYRKVEPLKIEEVNELNYLVYGLRNRIMADNIAAKIKSYGCKRAIVRTGSGHALNLDFSGNSTLDPVQSFTSTQKHLEQMSLRSNLVVLDTISYEKNCELSPTPRPECSKLVEPGAFILSKEPTSLFGKFYGMFDFGFLTH